jgi:hypothetical protein
MFGLAIALFLTLVTPLLRADSPPPLVIDEAWMQQNDPSYEPIVIPFSEGAGGIVLKVPGTLTTSPSGDGFLFTPVKPVPIYASWDINQDGVCNMIDLMLVKLQMATYNTFTYTYFDGATGKVVVVTVPASPDWNPAMDVNKDGVVNMIDYQIVKKHVGQLSPIIGYK